MKTILKMRDICKAHTKCFDGCPLYADGECLVCIPPANLDDEQLYLIGKVVEQEPKTGHWIAKSFHEVYCDNCGFDFDIMTNKFIDKMKYCPNCGAKMVDPQESEDKKFHCGIEESGFHAYNCNDCPNKCDVYYQWDKEMKNDGLQ